MPRLANISGEQAVRAFRRAGYEIRRQRGSHMILRCTGKPPLTVPRHRELAPGLLRKLIRQAGLTVEEFLELVCGLSWRSQPDG